MRILYIIIVCLSFTIAKTQSWHALGEGLNERVNKIAVDQNLVYAGGWFTNAGGNAAADYIAVWDGQAWQKVGVGLNNTVYDIAIHGNDIFVGGAFTNASGKPDADYIARWDGSAWHALGSGLNKPVFALAFQGDDLFVGGRFTDADGNPQADYIARWDGNNWYDMGTGGDSIPGTIWSIVVNQNDVYAGGSFHSLGEVPDTRAIARWDGTQWNSVGNGFGGDMGVIALHFYDGNLYAGGDGGPLGVSACGIAKWDGNSWHPLGDGLSNCLYGEGGHTISSLNESIYVGGVFENVGIENTTGIARWYQDTWNALGEPNFQWDPQHFNTNSVFALASQENSLYVGGVFDSIAGIQGTRNIAMWKETTVSSDEVGSSTFAKSIQIYPNPVGDAIHLRFPDANKSITHLELIDVTGKTVHLQNHYSETIPAAHLSPGIYYLTISSAENSHTILVLKE